MLHKQHDVICIIYSSRSTICTCRVIKNLTGAKVVAGALVEGDDDDVEPGNAGAPCRSRVLLTLLQRRHPAVSALSHQSMLPCSCKLRELALNSSHLTPALLKSLH